MSLLMKEIQYVDHILSTKGIKPLPLKTKAIQNMHPPKMPKQVCAFLGLIGYYRKFIKKLAKIAKPLTLITCEQAKFKWTPTQNNAFLMLNKSIIQAPILHYPDLKKCYIIYTWISGAHNKTADCLSYLVELSQTNLHQSTCYLPHTWTDLHLTPGVRQCSNIHLMIPYHKQMLLCQSSLKQETLPQNLNQ